MLRLRFLLILTLLPGFLLVLDLIYLMITLQVASPVVLEDAQPVVNIYIFFRNYLYALYLPYALIVFLYLLVVKIRSKGKVKGSYVAKGVGILLLGLLLLTFAFFLAAMVYSILKTIGI